jgi:hypothetical protein
MVFTSILKAFTKRFFTEQNLFYQNIIINNNSAIGSKWKYFRVGILAKCGKEGNFNSTLPHVIDSIFSIGTITRVLAK